MRIDGGWGMGEYICAWRMAGAICCLVLFVLVNVL